MSLRLFYTSKLYIFHIILATCVIYGDPHSYTIDYKSYTFNGHCSYYLLSDANYNITADFKACTRHRHVTCLWELTVICDDHNVTFYRNGFVYVDGNLVHLPFQTNDGKVTIYDLAPYIILKIECNDIIFILKWLPRHVIIMVPPQLFRATRGTLNFSLNIIIYNIKLSTIDFALSFQMFEL